VLQRVNLSDKLARFHDLWSPKAIATVNDFRVKPAGEFVWHSHDVPTPGRVPRALHEEQRCLTPARRGLPGDDL
jgi:hypothetical protein